MSERMFGIYVYPKLANAHARNGTELHGSVGRGYSIDEWKTLQNSAAALFLITPEPLTFEEAQALVKLLEEEA